MTNICYGFDVQVVGLGNYTHLLTRHSIGMLFLDHVASQLNLTWSKNKSIYSNITQTTIYVDPSQSSRQSKQTKLSKKEKKAKKKKWDFGSESDEDINIGDNIIIQNENDVNKSSDL